MDARETTDLRSILADKRNSVAYAKRVAEWIANERRYRWVGLYQVTSTEIGMIACTGGNPPAFPRFPVTRGLCGAAVARKALVNVGNVEEDPRWLTTFGSTRSEIIVPVFGRDAHVAGLIDVESDTRNAFGAMDEAFLQACAAEIVHLF